MNFDLEQAPASHAYKLLVGLVAPRPIALITSMDESGRLNAAPFSAYNYLCTDPPILGIGVTNRPGQTQLPKDTARNIRRTGEFVVNVVTEDIAQKMNICATDFPQEVSEVEMAGFTTAPSQKVKPPRLAEAHAALECVEYTTMEIGHSGARGRGVCGRLLRRSSGPVRQGRRPTRHWPHERSGQLHPHPRCVPHHSPHLRGGVAARA